MGRRIEGMIWGHGARAVAKARTVREAGHRAAREGA